MFRTLSCGGIASTLLDFSAMAIDRWQVQPCVPMFVLTRKTIAPMNSSNLEFETKRYLSCAGDRWKSPSPARVPGGRSSLCSRW